MTAIGIGGAVYTELQAIAGDASRVFNVTGFDDLKQIINNIEKTTCKGNSKIQLIRYKCSLQQ